MKLQLWIAEQVDDRPSYNLIAKTKKEITEMMKGRPDIKYSTLSHIEIEYASGFDLFEQITGEGGGRSASCYKRLKEIKLMSDEEVLRLTDEE